MTHLIAGVIALVLGLAGMIAWWDAFGEFLRGFAPIALVLVGLTAIGAHIKNHSSTTEFDESDETHQAPLPDREG